MFDIVDLINRIIVHCSFCGWLRDNNLYNDLLFCVTNLNNQRFHILTSLINVLTFIRMLSMKCGEEFYFLY